MEIKYGYEAPVVEIVEVEVEKGFSVSDPSADPMNPGIGG